MPYRPEKLTIIRSAPRQPKTADPFYTSTTWKQLRTAAMARDSGRCVLCSRPAIRVDHIKPRKAGGTDTLGNLRCLCATCDARGHRDKGGHW